MNKLKNEYIDKMIKNQLSSTEIDFLLYIANYQNDFGVVSSVYYKEVCSAINISIQKFYDIISNLYSKGLILVEKMNRADICVSLVENDFSAENYSVGYLKVSSIDFQNEKFMSMKAGAKLLYLYMQRFIEGKRMLVKNFYEKFCVLFHKSKKSIQNYLRELKKNFYLFISKKRNKAYNYEITIKKSAFLNKSELNIPFEKEGLRDNIKRLIIHNFSKSFPEGMKEQEVILRDISGLILTKKAMKRPDAVPKLVKAIKNSLEQQRHEGKKRPILNAALVNRIFSSSL